jgi:hypothetical protein
MLQGGDCAKKMCRSSPIQSMSLTSTFASVSVPFGRAWHLAGKAQLPVVLPRALSWDTLDERIAFSRRQGATTASIFNRLLDEAAPMLVPE